MEDKPPFNPDELKRIYGAERQIDEQKAKAAYQQLRTSGSVILFGIVAFLVLSFSSLMPNHTMVGVAGVVCFLAAPVFFLGAAASFGIAVKEPWLLWVVASVVLIPLGMLVVFLYARHKMVKYGLMAPNNSLQGRRP